MAIVMYRCQSCGGLHEASVRPGGGSVYLRCVVTRAWAWHEPSNFLTASASAAPAASRPAPAQAKAAPARKAAAPKRAAAARTPAARKAAPRKAAKKAPARTASVKRRKR